MPLFTQSAFLKALGWTLLDSFWQMALLWLFYRLLTWQKRKGPAAFRHLMALLCLSVGLLGSVFSFFRYFLSGTESPILHTIHFIRSGGSPAVGFFTRLLSDQALPLLSTSYLFMLFAGMVRYGWLYHRTGQLCQRGLYKAGPEYRVFVQETGRILGIKKKLRLWLSDQVTTPLTLGYLKPVILLPLSILCQLDTRQMEAILLHELAHIKRNDYLLNLALAITENLFFFNPFARLLIHTLKKEREICCDDLVLQFDYDPHAYASALFYLAKTRQEQPPLVMAAAGKNDGLLLERIKRVLRQEGKERVSFTKSLVPGLTLLAVLAVAALSSKRPETPTMAMQTQGTKTLVSQPTATQAYASPVRTKPVPGYTGPIPVSVPVNLLHPVAAGRTPDAPPTRPALENKPVNSVEPQASAPDQQDPALAELAKQTELLKIQPEDFPGNAELVALAKQTESLKIGPDFPGFIPPQTGLVVLDNQALLAGRDSLQEMVLDQAVKTLEAIREWRTIGSRWPDTEETRAFFLTLARLQRQVLADLQRQQLNWLQQPHPAKTLQSRPAKHPRIIHI